MEFIRFDCYFERMKSSHKILTVFSVVSFLTLAACAGNGVKNEDADKVATASESLIPLFKNYQVNRFVLGNGLRLLIVEDHSSPTLAFQTWFRVGSRDEVPGRTGLAHFFEHMMFKETKNLKDGEFDRILEGAGAEGENAFTSRDYTAYVEEMPKDKLELTMKAESDRMVNLVLSEAGFKSEREVVQNERRYRNENNPDGIMYQEIFDSAFTKHPYHWPVIGYQKDLEDMTTTDAADFYHAYYSPNHATLIVVGDVVPNQVLAMAKKYYGDLPGSTTPVHTVPQEPAQTSAKHKLMKLNIQVEKLLAGYKIPEITNEDIPALQVLQSVLTGGNSSRLHRAMVETGIASGVEAYDLEDKDPSLLIVMANLQKGKKATFAESAMLKEIAKLSREPINETELSRAKNRLNFGFYEGLVSNDEKARFLGHYEAVGNGFELGLKIQNKIQTVTALDVQAAAKKYLDPNNRTVITGVQK